MMWNKKQTLREHKQAIQAWLLGATFRYLLAGTAALLLVLNVMQTSTVSTKGYELGDLQKQIDQLHHETARLDVEIADYRSMKSIEARLASMQFTPATDVSYVAPIRTAVAVR